jgi:hypothetical protein
VTRILGRRVEARIGADGRPLAFCWRRRWHRVAEVLEEWVYRRPWWEAGATEEREAERAFYRVRAESGGVFELAVEPDGSATLHRAFD